MQWFSVLFYEGGIVATINGVKTYPNLNIGVAGITTANIATAVISAVLRLDPDTESVTAAGGITPTSPHMRVEGNGGAVTITANPQIAAGTDGDLLLLEGEDDTNTVSISNGTGLHLHGGGYTMGGHDYILLSYDAGEAEWQEITRNAPASEKAWSFASPAGTTGTFYFGGFYEFAATDNDFSPAVNFGTANAAKAAHLFVVLGAVSTDEITITVTGTSITDAGVRSAADTETIVIPDVTAVDTYYETSKKWLGQVAIEVTAGTAKTCNYGFAKYWDNNNNDFRVVGIESTWLGGANDGAADIRLRHHSAAGWTFNGGAPPTPPASVTTMATDHVTEINIVNGENGAWKRANLNTTVSGSGGEGTIIEIVTSANRAFELGDILLRVRAD